jgi:outer membrane protein assembly factor BamB
MKIFTPATRHGNSTLLLACLFTLSANAQVVGYRGDGLCVTPNAKLPDKLAVVWQTSLPNWGLGCPIVVKDRVYVVSEPDRDHDFPVLLCLSATDGKVLWQREIPHETDKVARDAWHDHLVALRNLYRMRFDYSSTTDKEAAAKKLEASGGALNDKGQVTWKGDGSNRSDRVDVKLARIFNKGGLYFDVWHLGGLHRIGYGFPTPVSDGQRIYVATGLHSFACYDLDGKLVWQARSVGQGSSQAGYGGDDFCKNARSPLIYKNLLISDVGNLVRAFDKDTGKLLWSDKHTGHEIVSPVIITIAGKDYLLTATVTAYALTDGKKVSVEGWKNHGGTMLVKSDERDVVFFTGGGEHGGWENKGQPPCETPPPAAVKFAREGDTLKAKVLWSGIDGQTSGECHTGLVYLNGKLYHPNGIIMDAATGKTLAGKIRDRNNRATPATRHLSWIVGERIVGVREEKGTGQVEVYDLAGKNTDLLTLTPPVAEGERRDRIFETVGAPSWGFSYGSPFTVSGNRLYIRSHGELWCLGEK